jgi:hypothetical protein
MDENERMLNYWVVLGSTFRDAYFFGPGSSLEKGDSRIKRFHDIIKEEVKHTPVEIIINQDERQIFAVKPNLPEEDKEFLRTVELHYEIITPEENDRLGKLLGYPCNFEMEGTAVSIKCIISGKAIELFTFRCVLSGENIQKCKELVQDVRRVLTEKLNSSPPKVVMVSNGKNVEQMGGKRRKQSKKTKSKRKTKKY